LGANRHASSQNFPGGFAAADLRNFAVKKPWLSRSVKVH
jgi:hypothetical protein